MTIVKYLPSWFPFNHIHSHAHEGRTLAYSAIDKPYEYVQQQMKRGVDRPSCTAEFIHAYESELGRIDTESESFIKWGSGSLYARTFANNTIPVLSLNFYALKLGVKQ